MFVEGWYATVEMFDGPDRAVRDGGVTGSGFWIRARKFFCLDSRIRGHSAIVIYSVVNWKQLTVTSFSYTPSPTPNTDKPSPQKH